MEINNALWQLIAQSDSISKAVLFVLLLMSILCWTVAIYKSIVLSMKLKQLESCYKQIQGIKNWSEFVAKTSMLSNTFAGEIIAHFLTDFKMALQSFKDSSSVRSLTDNDWQILQTNMSQTICDAYAKEEALTSIIGTCAQASPLLGLFGTVWGLIHAFLGISYNKSADIAAVAPGIAEALITTFAGLLVAIPALILYNYLQSRFKFLEQSLIALMDRCFWVMRSSEREQSTSYSHFTEPTVERELQ